MCLRHLAWPLCASLIKQIHMQKNETIQIKQYVIKYLLVIVGLAILRLLLHEFVPNLFSETIVGDGYTQTKTTFFGIYQINIFNMIAGVIMSLDLFKMGRNWIIIPILTIISMTAGLFFFSILILDNLINRHEQV